MDQNLLFIGENKMILFHYTTLEALYLILDSNTFILSSFCKSNDYKEKNWKVFSDGTTIDHYKYISTCAGQDSRGIKNLGFANGMLWHFYGEKHSGICIELDANMIEGVEHIKSGFVNYRDGVCHVDEQNSIDYLMEKRTCWKGENEYRMIFNADNPDIRNFSQYITGIYFGACTNNLWEAYNNVKEKMLKHGPLNCKFYKVYFDQYDGRLNRIDLGNMPRGQVSDI